MRKKQRLPPQPPPSWPTSFAHSAWHRWATSVAVPTGAVAAFLRFVPLLRDRFHPHEPECFVGRKRQLPHLMLSPDDVLPAGHEVQRRRRIDVQFGGELLPAVDMR